MCAAYAEVRGRDHDHHLPVRKDGDIVASVALDQPSVNGLLTRLDRPEPPQVAVLGVFRPLDPQATSKRAVGSTVAAHTVGLRDTAQESQRASAGRRGNLTGKTAGRLLAQSGRGPS